MTPEAARTPELAGALPSGWVTVPLGCLLREPLRNGRSGQATTDGTGVRTLTLTAVTRANFSDQHTKMTVTPLTEAEGLWLEPGDILVERSNTPELVGTAAMFRGPRHWAIFPDLLIRVRPHSDISAPYLEALMRSPSLRSYFRSSAQGIAGSMPKISQDTVSNMPVILAPSAEQRRIVVEIEKHFTRLDEAVATLEGVRAKLKQARASVLKAAVEGRLVPTEAELARAEGRPYEPASVLLERVLEERRRRWPAGKKYQLPVKPAADVLPPLPEGWVWATSEMLFWDAGYGTSQKCSYGAGGPPVLRIPNVQNQAVSLDDLKFASGCEGLSADGVLKPGDFVFIRTNGSRGLIGRGALVVEPLPGTYYFASYLIRLRLITLGPLPRWVSLAWHSNVVRDQLLKDAVSSAGQHNVSLSAAARYVVPLPPAAEQARIVAEVERRMSVLDALDRTVEENLARCGRLRQSILKRAFEGKLVPHDPREEPASELLARIKAGRAAKVAP